MAPAAAAAACPLGRRPVAMARGGVPRSAEGGAHHEGRDALRTPFLPTPFLPTPFLLTPFLLTPFLLTPFLLTPFQPTQAIRDHAQLKANQA